MYEYETPLGLRMKQYLKWHDEKRENSKHELINELKIGFNGDEKGQHGRTRWVKTNKDGYEELVAIFELFHLS